MLERKHKGDHMSFQSHIKALRAPAASPGTISSSGRMSFFFFHLLDFLLSIKTTALWSYLLSCKHRLLSSTDAKDLGLVQMISTQVRVSLLCSALTHFVCKRSTLASACLSRLTDVLQISPFLLPISQLDPSLICAH